MHRVSLYFYLSITSLIYRPNTSRITSGGFALADEIDDGLERLSPTPAAAFLGCDASAARTLEGRRGLRNAVEAADDPQAALVIGHEHEAACLAGLN